ncbi:MAG TPA: hypothetical protein VFE23_17100 [Usitatibacter sp.]|nr:hypothetical protein [Usitatibacter sp.]
MPLTGRGFSAAFEAIAENWRGAVVSADSWVPKSAAGVEGGQASGYFVSSGTLNGFAKPSTLDADNIPRAAHEKISADLGYDLGLPMCPVILHQWTAPPAGNQPNVAISLVPFSSVFKWGVVAGIADVAAKLQAEIAPWASRMVAFDTWLSNADRVNDGNLLVSKATHQDRGSALSCAYIDYSYTMLHSWRAGHGNMGCVGPYPCGVSAVDVSVLTDTISKIEQVSDGAINDVVTRLPANFLSTSDGQLIVDGLIYRRGHLRATLRQTFGGIP